MVQEDVMIGGIYRHYKGNRYRVLTLARHSETMEDMVVYQGLAPQGGTWVRPIAMFLETVICEGVPQPRFALEKI